MSSTSATMALVFCCSPCSVVSAVVTRLLVKTDVSHWRLQRSNCSLSVGRKTSSRSEPSSYPFNASPGPSKSLASSYVYCAETVRRCDRENFLFHLFLPKRHRYQTLAVAAFNVELSQVFRLAFNSTAALMRLRFWKDVVTHLPQGKVPEHPVAEALLHTYRLCGLSEEKLNDLVDARLDSLSGEIYGRMDALQAHFRHTFGTALMLVLQILKVNDSHADQAAGHIGTVLGLVNTVRALPTQLKCSRLNLPEDLLKKHAITSGDLKSLASDKCRHAIADVCSIACHHRQIARSLKDKMPKEALVIFLCMTVSDHYLRLLHKVNFDVSDLRFERPYRLLPWALLWRKLIGRY